MLISYYPDLTGDTRLLLSKIQVIPCLATGLYGSGAGVHFIVLSLYDNELANPYFTRLSFSNSQIKMPRIVCYEFLFPPMM